MTTKPPMELSLIEKLCELPKVMHDGMHQWECKSVLDTIRQHTEAQVELLDKAKYYTGFYLKQTTEEMLIKAHEAIEAVITALNMAPAISEGVRSDADSSSQRSADNSDTVAPPVSHNEIRDNEADTRYPDYKDFAGFNMSQKPLRDAYNRGYLDATLKQFPKKPNTTEPVSLKDVYDRILTEYGSVPHLEHIKAVLDAAGVKYVD